MSFETPSLPYKEKEARGAPPVSWCCSSGPPAVARWGPGSLDLGPSSAATPPGTGASLSSSPSEDTGHSVGSGGRAWHLGCHTGCPGEEMEPVPAPSSCKRLVLGTPPAQALPCGQWHACASDWGPCPGFPPRSVQRLSTKHGPHATAAPLRPCPSSRARPGNSLGAGLGTIGTQNAPL